MQTYELPIVSAITPDASTVGCRIAVTGANLQYTTATVGGVKCEVEYKSPTSVIVIVAADAKSGPVVLSNDTGNALNAPKFTVTVEWKPKAETELEKTAREQFEAEQKAKADAEAAGQLARQAAVKEPLETHHERVEHRDEQEAAADGQPWPGKKHKWKG